MLMSFQQALQSSQGSERAILLGNGFSIAGAPIFDYRNLFQYAQIDRNVRNVFIEMETFDFEVVISKVENAYRLLEIYTTQHPALIDELKSLSEALRRNLAEVISSKHALYQTVFLQQDNDNNPVRSCFSFLSKFNKIFTTNYDLLLYWSINLSKEKFYKQKKIVIPGDDGFSRLNENLVWRGNYNQRAQTVFFLHGALFLFQKDGVLMKMERDKGDDLLSIVAENITDHKNLPLIVLEGESKNKISKIIEHPYLNDGLQHLGNLYGSLFIFGHSLDKSDDHIFEKIKRSDFSKIYISVFNENAIHGINARAHHLFSHPMKKREIYFFDASSANVWI